MTVINPNVAKSRLVGQFSIDDYGEISGQIQHKTENYDARRLRSSLGNDKSVNDIVNADDEMDLESEEVQNQDRRYEPLVLKFDMSSDSYSDVLGDAIAITPLMQYAITETPFDIAERDYPIFLNSAIHKIYHMTYDVPSGYEVQSLPETVNLALPDNLGAYSYVSSQTNGKITITKKYKINTDIILPMAYSALKEFFDIVVAKDSEQIVFKKL